MCQTPLPFIHPTYVPQLTPTGLNLYRGIAFVGLPRAGKTSIGTALAQQHYWPFIDSDAAIALEQKLSIPELIARDGITAFRDLEKEWLTRLCTPPLESSDHEFVVLSTGGGMPCHHNLMGLLKQHFLTVHLDLDLKSWRERMYAPPHEITTRLDNAGLCHLYQERSGIYRQAHYTLTQRGSLQHDVQHILSMLLT